MKTVSRKVSYQLQSTPCEMRRSRCHQIGSNEASSFQSLLLPLVRCELRCGFEFDDHADAGQRTFAQPKTTLGPIFKRWILHTFRNSNPNSQISRMCRIPFRFGTPDTIRYESPMVSILKKCWKISSDIIAILSRVYKKQFATPYPYVEYHGLLYVLTWVSIPVPM